LVDFPRDQGVWPLTAYGSDYSPEHGERLRKIHARLIEARRELDALIGDAYLRPRANIVPVHFLDLASAVEKLRWAEKEWRELDRELAEKGSPPPPPPQQKESELAGAKGSAGRGNPAQSDPAEEESEEPHSRGAVAEAVPSHSSAS
jgi:hypothetical protein